MPGCSGGRACMVAPQGVCVVAHRGVKMVARGVYVVAKNGGHAWLQITRGACVGYDEIRRFYQ